MKIWPGDLNAFTRWQEEKDYTARPLPEALDVSQTLSLTAPLRKALAERRSGTTQYPGLRWLQTTWRDYPYRFVFECYATLWQTTMQRMPYQHRTPEGHIIEGGVDGLVGYGELLSVVVTDKKINPEQLQESWHWRTAMLGFSPTPRAVHLEVFRVRYQRHAQPGTAGRDSSGGNFSSPAQLTVTDFRRLTFYPYADLRRDVQAIADEFATLSTVAGWRGR